MDENQERIPGKKSVFLLAILSIITLLIYDKIWYIRRTNELNNLRTSAKFNKAMPIVALTLYLALITLYIVLITFSPQISTGVPAISFNDVPIEFTINLSLIIIILVILIIMMLLMAFKTSKILNQALANKGEKVKISGFFALIFNFLYIQYEINRIINDKENNKRIGPWIMFILIFVIVISIAAIIIMAPDFLKKLFFPAL
ncbi:DUF4234 domain-containing protein [Candidatus Pacearchaeota archaeon]|nr:DUF4234 domain-containing protein [Candidatus Pacearchaeota archaeon]